ncbi:hypothetical protein CC78DRAFT_533984 [Lojkania enalia]|uniref:Uncharacterized protein n=1 Tax=Lojkania enalia TaxID=147567 RepID=A0A9P4MZ73_9PLEO|nr:hypothetical protein CC78DRAFT_533984 [Didymosphaeria enalia]
MPSILAVRDPFSDAKDTLSSWDKCMDKAYCKSVTASRIQRGEPPAYMPVDGP